MMRFKFAAVVILMALTAIMALAADITGTWTGQMAGPNGEGFQLSFTFKQHGAKLTGTVQGPEGEPVAISDGKVEGDRLSFTVAVHEQMIRHEGTISGDEIKLSSKSDQRDHPAGEITLTRSK